MKCPKCKRQMEMVKDSTKENSYYFKCSNCQKEVGKQDERKQEDRQI